MFFGARWGYYPNTQEKNYFFQPDEPTCTLFTGRIGCGKSTELIRLQAELESLGFHDDLEITDVGIADVQLAWAIENSVGQNLRYEGNFLSG